MAKCYRLAVNFQIKFCKIQKKKNKKTLNTKLFFSNAFLNDQSFVDLWFIVCRQIVIFHVFFNKL